VQFQAATIDLQTGEATDIRQWRDGVRTGGNQVGIASDGLNGFRFRLIVDQTLAQTLSVDSVKVPYLR
jgi:hypothetical protein